MMSTEHGDPGSFRDQRGGWDPPTFTGGGGGGDSFERRLSRLEEIVGQIRSPTRQGSTGLLGYVEGLANELRSLDKRTESVAKTTYDFLSAQSLSDQPDEYPLARIVPVRLSLEGGPASLPGEIPKGWTVGWATPGMLTGPLTRWLNVFGFELMASLQPEISSWRQRLFASSKETLSRPEVQERLDKMERAIEVVTLSKPQATVDAAEAEATAVLLGALATYEHAVLQAGSILMIKTPGGVVSRNLSPSELLALERDSSILHEPANVLRVLAERVAGPRASSEGDDLSAP